MEEVKYFVGGKGTAYDPNEWERLAASFLYFNNYAESNGKKQDTGRPKYIVGSPRPRSLKPHTLYVQRADGAPLNKSEISAFYWFFAGVFSTTGIQSSLGEAEDDE